MAKYNEILTGRHNRFIQKLFGMKGGPPAPQLSGDVQMSHQFFHGVENRYIESWNRFGVSTALAATVGQVDSFRLRNPTTSNVIAVVEKLLIGNPNGVTQEIDVSVGVIGVDLTTPFANQTLDQRQGGPNQQSPLIASSAVNSTGGLLGLFVRAFVISNGQYEVIVFEDQEFNITPGTAMDVRGTSNNQALTISLMWRERLLEDSE